MNEKPEKPLGGKAYGSIGHLPQSRLGPGDWHVHEGQARICLEKPRKGDRVIVTEKLDGACMSVANINGEIVALSRAGYRAADALYPHLKAFAPYVARHRFLFSTMLRPGERLVGEWMALAHGTKYDQHMVGFAPFIAFDLFRDGKRVLREEFDDRLEYAQNEFFPCAMTLYDGPLGFSIEKAMQALAFDGREIYGFHGALEPVEGAVWRVEREDRVDFLAKYVRPDKIDGKYLPGTAVNQTDDQLIWNWKMDEYGDAA